MAEARGRANRKPRLIGVNLPWMEVEHRRRTIDTVHPTYPPARDGIGKQPEVAASRNRQIGTSHPDRRRRHLDERSALAVDSMDVPWGVGNAVPIVSDR